MERTLQGYRTLLLPLTEIAARANAARAAISVKGAAAAGTAGLFREGT